MTAVIPCALAFVVAALPAGYRNHRGTRLHLIQLLAISAIFLIRSITRAVVSGLFNGRVVDRTGVLERSAARVNP